MTGKIVEIIIMESIACLMFVFAYFIGVKKKMELIAGYNERTAGHVTDKNGLARLIGRTCLLVGLASALMPAFTSLWGHQCSGYYMSIGGYGGFIAGIIAMTILQARDFTSTHLHEE
jgi:hypothetical protein